MVQLAEYGDVAVGDLGVEALADFDGTVLVLFGDTPLLRTETIQAMADIMEGPEDPAIAVLGFLWVAYLAFAKFNEARQGKAEWAEVGVLGIVGAVVLIFVIGQRVGLQGQLMLSAGLGETQLAYITRLAKRIIIMAASPGR